jgi:hypothetical protein
MDYPNYSGVGRLAVEIAEASFPTPEYSQLSICVGGEIHGNFISITKLTIPIYGS